MEEELEPQLGGEESEDVVDQEEGISEAEEKARESGWRPREEYEGDGWVDAEEYLRRGQQKRGDLYRDLEIQQHKLTEMNDLLREMAGKMSRAEQEGYQRALKEIEAKRDEAIESGDREAVKAIDEHYMEMKSAIKQKEEEIQVPESMKRAASDFEKRNSTWFNDSTTESRAMKRFAQQKEVELLQSHPNLAYDDILNDIEYEVKRAFPDHFRNKNRDSAPVVESGGSSVNAKKSRFTLRDLTQAEIESGKKLVKLGVYKDMNEFVEHAKQYKVGA